MSSENSMLMGVGQPLPRLGTAATQTVDIDKEYKSGARYTGQVLNNRKAGRGVFIWPNGAKYEGEFLNNVRHGKGLQVWPDGAVYEGDFVDDMRHGQGTLTWENGECFKGKYFRDRRHGIGQYTWPDHSHYTGSFYMDKKQGYGTFVFANGNKFEGLYKADEREGPGVMTYPNGCQDVGLWHRENLVKLCTAVPEAFTMKDHQEFDYSPDEHKLTIPPVTIDNRYDVIDPVINPPDQFKYDPVTDLTEKTKNLFNDSLNTRSLAFDAKIYDQEFFDDTQNTNRINSSDSNRISAQENEPVLAWNNTPSAVAMQQNVLRHKSQQDRVEFDVEQILRGERGKHGDKGPIETASEKFLASATAGDLEEVRAMLHAGKVYVDVADKNGYSALLASAINWHQPVINCLLDNGSNVNQLTDEGVSTLAACHVFSYPVDSFKYNNAERYLERPLEVEQEPGYCVDSALKGILTNTSKKRQPSQERKPNTKSIDEKKIEKYRAQYASTQEKHRAEYVDNDDHPIESDPEDDRPPSGCSDKPEVTNRLSPTRPDSGRILGTLNVKRTTKINFEDLMQPGQDLDSRQTREDKEIGPGDIEFDSTNTLHSYHIDVTNQMLDRCATHLSTNDLVVNRQRSTDGTRSSLGTVRLIAIDKSRQREMEATIRLLLKRGADPNVSRVPIPVIFFAIKAGDVEAVKLLLLKGASTSVTMATEKGGLSPLHIACGIPGAEGVQITELLLNSLGDPDVRSIEDDSFLNRNLEEEWKKDVISDETKLISGGRTPLHIACARDDNYQNACKVVRLLLRHHANPNLLCNGHSPLSLAITSGNDLAIDELLCFGADPCLPLTHGVGSALCVASSTEYEHRRAPQARLQLIDKLISSGADILAPIPIGPKRLQGTAVDYAYHLYNLDRRIAHMPYHALTPAERETFNARRKLLAHIGDILREKAVDRERMKLQEEEFRSRSPSPNFVYTGAGAPLPPGYSRAKNGRVILTSDSKGSIRSQDGDVRKPLFRYCYECGRSVGVRLAACTRCKEVYYCSKACKLKAWNARHKEECVRLGGRSPSPRNKDKRVDSPTPATDPEYHIPTTVSGITATQGIKSPGRKSGKPEDSHKTLKMGNYSYV